MSPPKAILPRWGLWPESRLRRVRRLLLRGLVLVSLAAVPACGGGTATTIPPTTTTTMPPTTTTSPVTPSTLAPPDGFDLSPIASAEAAASWAAGFPTLAGFRRVTPLATSGYGSMTIAFPTDWPWWMIGMDPSEVADVAMQQDERWAEGFFAMIEAESGTFDATHRVAAADPDSGGLFVVSVTLQEIDLDPATLADALVEAFEPTASEISILEDIEFPHGRYLEIELLFAGTLVGWTDNVAEEKVFVYDSVNGWLWGVTCYLHLTTALENLDVCLNILRSFAPGGWVEG